MKSAWVTIGTLLFCLATNAIAASRVYDLVESDAMDCRARAAIEAFDKDAHAAIDNLLGAVPYGDGFAVYDRIARTLVFALEPAGRHVFARNDGELWVQLPGRTSSEVIFEILDRKSTHEGQVRIVGMPSATGEFVIVEDRLLWFEDSDLVADGTGCVGLYEMVPRP